MRGWRAAPARGGARWVHESAFTGITSDSVPVAGGRAGPGRHVTVLSRSVAIARRRFYREAGPVQRTRVNHMIRISPVRLIGPDNEQIGVIETSEAMRMAQEAGLDLVEVVANSRPPVCKIMDYGKYKYELSKKDQKSRSSSKQAELKEIRLGRSVKIDPHDVQIRVDQARRFLMDGHKVQITQRFRGREMMHKELGLERLAEIVEDLSDVSKVEIPPRLLGRQASITLAPDKAKIEAIKRKQSKEEAAQAESAEAAQGRAEAADRPDHSDDDDGKQRKASRKVSNPVEDEISALLGE
ncbi:MAG: translation initiation factor IF-3 [Phycisphaerales bacterium JB039]